MTAEAGLPTAQDWMRLGVSPASPAVAAEDVFWAYGVWRTLAWLLGVRPDPPAELPERTTDGELVGGPLHTSRPDSASPMWQATRARCRREDLADAQRYWRHVRSLADR